MHDSATIYAARVKELATLLNRMRLPAAVSRQVLKSILPGGPAFKEFIQNGAPERQLGPWEARVEAWANRRSNSFEALVNRPEPTAAQREAGNYKKEHLDWNGLGISIENPKGSTRSGVSGDGTAWSVVMPAAYGYFKRTEGADGDHVDVYVGDAPESDKVFIVDQVDEKTGAFDEHKCLIGFPNLVAALRTYHDAFSDGRGAERVGDVTPMTVEDFKVWLKSEETKEPVSEALDNDAPWIEDDALSNKPCGASFISDDKTCREGDFSHAEGKQLVSKLRKHGGFTYEPAQNKVPKSGFAVSAYKHLEVVLNAKQLSVKAVKGFYDRAAETLKKDPLAHMGGWFDKVSGKIFLDVVQIHKAVGGAMEQAKQLKELAIFDLGKMAEIRLQNAAPGGRVSFIFPRGVSAEEMHEQIAKMVKEHGGDAVSNAGTSEGARLGWETRRVHSVATPVGEVAVHEIIGSHVKHRYFKSVDGKVSPATAKSIEFREGSGKHKETIAEADALAKEITQAHALNERTKDGADRYLASVNADRLAKKTGKFTHQIPTPGVVSNKACGKSFIGEEMECHIGETAPVKDAPVTAAAPAVAPKADKAESTAGAKAMSTMAPSGQIKMRKPKNVEEVGQLLGELRAHVEAAKALPDTDKMKELKVLHALQQQQRAIGASRKIADKISEHLAAQPEAKAGDAKPAGDKPVESSTASAKADVTAIKDGKNVVLRDVKKVNTLIEEVHKFANEAKKSGEKVNLNLCKVSVPGTNLFCGESLKGDDGKPIPREQMPQLAGTPVKGSIVDDEKKFPKDKAGEVNVGDAFVKELSERGIKTHDEEVPAASLKASQSELKGSNVAFMMSPEGQKAVGLQDNSIFVSQDGYVIDGHHRWAALVGLDSKDGKLGDTKIKTRRIDMPIADVLKAANEFTKKMGIAPKKLANSGNCGTGDGGFQPGNTCGAGGGRGSGWTGPTTLPVHGSSSARDFPHIPISKKAFHLVGTQGEYGLYGSKNERMGGRDLKVLHHPTGWLKQVSDRTTAAKMVSRHAASLRGEPPDYGGKDGWGATPANKWEKFENRNDGNFPMLNRETGTFSQGCLMAQIEPGMADAVRRFSAEKIAEGNLAEFGREASPHCTVLYGFDPEVSAAAVLDAYQGPKLVRFGTVARFSPPGKDYDVLHLTVVSPELEAEHQRLRDLFGEDVSPSDYGDYAPHVTLAYVKPGAHPELDGNAEFNTKDLVGFSGLKYSQPDGGKAERLLNRKPGDCPVCGEQATGRCRCAGPHTMEDLEKGHGLQCPNGHRWSGDLVLTPKDGDALKNRSEEERDEYSEHTLAIAAALGEAFADLKQRVAAVAAIEDPDEQLEAIAELRDELPDELAETVSGKELVGAIGAALAGAAADGADSLTGEDEDADGGAAAATDDESGGFLGKMLAAFILAGMSKSDAETASDEIAERARVTAAIGGAGILGNLEAKLAKAVESTDRDERTAIIEDVLSEMGGIRKPEPDDGSDERAVGEAAEEEPMLPDGTLRSVEMTGEIVEGWGYFKAATTERALAEFPAQELYRASDRREWREWPERWQDNGGEFYEGESDYPEGRMIAGVADRIWTNISAFGIPHAPFDYNSGMDVRPVSRAECEELGVELDDLSQLEHPLNFDLRFGYNGYSKGLEQELLAELGAGYEVDGGAIVNRKKSNAISNSGKPCGDSFISSDKECRAGSYNDPSGKFHGVVKEVTRIMPGELKPMNQMEANGAKGSMERSGKTPLEWAKSVDLSEPVKATIFSDGEIKLSDGHHRTLAAQIRNEPLNVTLQSVNAKNENLNAAVERINAGVAANESAKKDKLAVDVADTAKGASVTFKAKDASGTQRIYAVVASKNTRAGARFAYEQNPAMVLKVHQKTYDIPEVEKGFRATLLEIVNGIPKAVFHNSYDSIKEAAGRGFDEMLHFAKRVGNLVGGVEEREVQLRNRGGALGLDDLIAACDGPVALSNAGEFEEELHPRASDGKFASKGGVGLKEMAKSNPQAKAAVSILGEIERQFPGTKPLIVGGAVRDMVMGKTPKDFDIATPLPAARLQAAFHSHEIGNSADFGIVAIPHEGHTFEVAQFRTDGAYSDQRRPDSVTAAGSFDEDSKRRDFTINAMAMDSAGNLVDPQGGKADIEAKVIRAVGDPEARFTEDPLRMIRAARFAGRLGFDIEAKTMEAMKKLAPSVATISGERIRDEVFKAADNGKSLAKFVSVMGEAGLLEHTLPEVAAMRGLPHNPRHHPEGGVYEHVLEAVKASNTTDATTNVAILLHDIGKATTRGEKDGQPTYIAHEAAGIPLLEKAAARLKFSNEQKEAIALAVEHHMVGHNFDAVSDRLALRFRQEKNWPLLREVMRSDEAARGALFKPDDFERKMARADRLVEQFGKKEEMEKRLASVFTGKDIMAAAPNLKGASIGAVKSAVRDWVLERNFEVSPEQVRAKIIEESEALKNRADDFELLQNTAEFDESKHPRATNGRFSESGGAEVSPSGAGVGILFSVGTTHSDKFLARTVAEHFGTLKQHGVTVKLVAPGEDLGKISAGGQTFAKAGEYNPETKTVKGHVEPGILAHEMGHAEMDFALEQRRAGLRELSDSVAAAKADIYERSSDGSARLSPSDRILSPQSKQQELHNLMMEFDYSLRDDAAHPTGYSKAWKGVVAFDMPRAGQVEHPVGPDAGTGTKYGGRNSLSLNAAIPRHVNEAYAEFCRGQVLSDLKNRGVIDDVDKSYEFKAMGTKESRAAFLALRKAIGKMAQ